MIVPVLVALMSLAGAIWIVDNAKVDCFYHDEEILRIYDEHPQEYSLLVTEHDPLAGVCVPAADILDRARSRPHTRVGVRRRGKLGNDGPEV